MKVVTPITSPALCQAYDDFILSRKAMRCSKDTLSFYRYTAKRFIIWAEQNHHVSEPHEIKASLVRSFLAMLIDQGKSDWTINDNARAIHALLSFWYAEEYIPISIVFKMPKVAKKRLPSLTANQLRDILKVCNNVREKAIILLMADSGLRRSEVVSLNWGDLDMESGLCQIRNGKGGKSRSIVIGPTARRAICEYRTTLAHARPDDPLIQSKTMRRFTPGGFLQIFRRLSKKTGIHVTPHAMRRTFAILSIRAGMDLLCLQALMGHSSLEMVRHYAQLVEDDLIQAHKEHSPIENLSRM